jgi:hypothetical protein
MVTFPQVSPPKPCTRHSPPHPSYMPRPPHSSRFYHPHNSGWEVQVMESGWGVHIMENLLKITKNNTKQASNQPTRDLTEVTAFPVTIYLFNDPKQWDVLSPLLFNFASAYAIRKPKQYQQRLNLEGARQPVVLLMILACNVQTGVL